MPEPDCFLRYRMRCNAEFYYVGKMPRTGIGRYLPPTKEEINVFAHVRLSVCLSVCEQDYSKMCARIWMKCCVSTDVRTWTN